MVEYCERKRLDMWTGYHIYIADCVSLDDLRDWDQNFGITIEKCKIDSSMIRPEHFVDEEDMNDDDYWWNEHYLEVFEGKHENFYLVGFRILAKGIWLYYSGREAYFCMTIEKCHFGISLSVPCSRQNDEKEWFRVRCSQNFSGQWYTTMTRSGEPDNRYEFGEYEDTPYYRTPVPKPKTRIGRWILKMLYPEGFKDPMESEPEYQCYRYGFRGGLYDHYAYRFTQSW